MKDKFNRVVATGLIALTIASLTACDEVNIDIGVSPKDTEATTEELWKNPHQKEPTDFKGDVWKAMLANGGAYARPTNDVEHLLWQPIPIQFLQDEGLLYYDENNKLCINGKQPGGLYTPFSAEVFVDPNTSENDVYVLLNYKSDVIKSDVSKDVYVATWKLKYTIDDDDYATLQALNNDFKQRYFIQEMDKIYEPEVISKSVAIQSMVNNGSPFRLNNNTDNKFPNVYIDNIDYESKTITYAAKFKDGYKFYDACIYESDRWNNMKAEHSLTDDELEKYIQMETKQTLLGNCLISFNIANYGASLTIDQSKEKFNTSKDIHYLDNMNVNSTESNFFISY